MLALLSWGKKNKEKKELFPTCRHLNAILGNRLLNSTFTQLVLIQILILLVYHISKFKIKLNYFLK